jgi:hypothetical protein
MRFLLILLLSPVLFFSCKTRTAEGKDDAAGPSVSMADGSAEFADAKYTEIGRRHSTMFENGNIEGWVGMFADNAVLQWSNGDSLVGKKAIMDYWINRRDVVVEDIDLENDIWLPVKVNKSQQENDIPGVWLLHWHQYTAKYRNGKTLTGWVHNDYHFNAQDKVDRWIQYMDRAPVMAVTGAPDKVNTVKDTGN